MSSDDLGIIRQLMQWREQEQPAALATVVDTWGSAPRGVGSHMAINASTEFVGSVSGGCVEAAVVDEAMRVIESGEARTVEYGVSDDDAWAVGLACGGRVRVFIEPVE